MLPVARFPLRPSTVIVPSSETASKIDSGEEELVTEPVITELRDDAEENVSLDEEEFSSAAEEELSTESEETELLVKDPVITVGDTDTLLEELSKESEESSLEELSDAAEEASPELSEPSDDALESELTTAPLPVCASSV